MNRIRYVLSAVVALLALVVVGVASADQAPLPADDRGNVQITQLRYNVRGVDTPTNAKYEWVALRNIGNAAADLTGWTVEDATGNTYAFAAGSAWDDPATVDVESAPVLKPGRTVVVHTGRNTLPSADIAGAVNVYWGRFHHVWANKGKDAVALYNSGTRVDRLAYDPYTLSTS